MTIRVRDTAIKITYENQKLKGIMVANIVDQKTGETDETQRQNPHGQESVSYMRIKMYRSTKIRRMA